MYVYVCVCECVCVVIVMRFATGVRRVLGDGHGGHVHPPNIFNLGNCNCNVCKYALKFKKGCKQIAENCRGGLPSAPVHPPSWGAEHAPGCCMCPGLAYLLSVGEAKAAARTGL